MGCHSVNAALTPAQGFGAEVIFTFIFIFVVFATAISPFAGKLAPLSGGSSEYGPGKLTPFAVGMTILILHAVGIPFTGASMNPARFVFIFRYIFLLISKKKIIIIIFFSSKT
jgi:glycerol uptake facilitator-like aquaporin